MSGIAVKEVNNRVAPIGARGITRRKIYEDVAIRRVTFQIPFERLAVDFDPLPRALLCLISTLRSASGSSIRTVQQARAALELS